MRMFSFRLINKSCSIFSKALNVAGRYPERKLFSRWTHRRPVRVLTQEEFEGDSSDEHKITEQEYVEHAEANNRKGQIQWRYTEQDSDAPPDKSVPKLKRPWKKTEKQTTFDMLQTVIDAEGNLVYTKMSDNDRRISALLSTVKSRKHREEKKLILLEGKRLIREALNSKCRLQYLLFTRKDDLEFLKASLPKSGANLYKMPYKEMQMWSDLVTCPGIMGIFVQPEENLVPPENCLPITVICDNVREPGNLGSILRTCAGAGCQKVILTKGCANVWDTKVTRSASGAHFYLKIQSKLEWSQIKDIFDENCKVYIADSANFDHNIDSTPLIPYYATEFQKHTSTILIVGGETHGLSEDAYECARDFNGIRLNIPLMNGVESLNSGVALGVIIFEIKKQLLAQNPNLEIDRILE